MYVIDPNNRSLKNIRKEALEECFLRFQKLAVDKHVLNQEKKKRTLMNEEGN